MKNMDRRAFIRNIGIGMAIMKFGGSLYSGERASSGTGQTGRKPNVLFIAVDDLNDWVNCLGGRPGVHTPNLDKLAGRGVIFTNAHCAAPACNPSRASVLTGIRPSTSGVYNNDQDWRKVPSLKDVSTIPKHFRANGYRTVGGGKLFHCLSWIRISYGIDQNDFEIWDEYFPSKKRSLPETVWPEGTMEDDDHTFRWRPLAGARTRNRPSYYFDWGALPDKEEQWADHKVVDWAIGELEKKHTKPFFLAAGIFRPHIPWFVPQKYFDLYPLDKIELPEIQENDLDDCSPVGKSFCRRQWQRWILEQNLWREAVQGYLASISFADAQLGRLLDALDESDYSNNTIIVLWSDHGMHIGEKEHWEKFTLWEESTRVPLIMVAPGLTQPAGVCKQPVSLLDIYPTLVELCGLENVKGLDGQSLVEQLRNPQAHREEPAVITWGRNNHAVRTERWRYIHYRNGDEELYDHLMDPNEFTNLADQDKYDSLKKELAQWLPKINAEPVE